MTSERTFLLKLGREAVVQLGGKGRPPEGNSPAAKNGCTAFNFTENLSLDASRQENWLLLVYFRETLKKGGRPWSTRQTARVAELDERTELTASVEAAFCRKRRPRLAPRGGKKRGRRPDARKSRRVLPSAGNEEATTPVGGRKESTW